MLLPIGWPYSLLPLAPIAIRLWQDGNSIVRWLCLCFLFVSTVDTWNPVSIQISMSVMGIALIARQTQKTN
jgi:hypothetical protein